MSRGQTNLRQARSLRRRITVAIIAATAIGSLVDSSVWSKDSAPAKARKQVIGATSELSEVSSGIAFEARIDTGAETCSLHVERIEIQDKTARRVDNIGKAIRIELKDKHGKLHWIDGV